VFDIPRSEWLYFPTLLKEIRYLLPEVRTWKP
jgi:hypothetical protein